MVFDEMFQCPCPPAKPVMSFSALEYTRSHSAWVCRTGANLTSSKPVRVRCYAKLNWIDYGCVRFFQSNQLTRSVDLGPSNVAKHEHEVSAPAVDATAQIIPESTVNRVGSNIPNGSNVFRIEEVLFFLVWAFAVYIVSQQWLVVPRALNVSMSVEEWR